MWLVGNRQDYPASSSAGVSSSAQIVAPASTAESGTLIVLTTTTHRRSHGKGVLSAHLAPHPHRHPDLSSKFIRTSCLNSFPKSRMRLNHLSWRHGGRSPMCYCGHDDHFAFALLTISDIRSLCRFSLMWASWSMMGALLSLT